MLNSSISRLRETLPNLTKGKKYILPANNNFIALDVSVLRTFSAPPLDFMLGHELWHVREGWLKQGEPEETPVESRESEKEADIGSLQYTRNAEGAKECLAILHNRDHKDNLELDDAVADADDTHPPTITRYDNVARYIKEHPELFPVQARSRVR